MARWDYRYLGAEAFPETLSALEIRHFFTLDLAELDEVRRRRGPMDRLAVALQIGFIKMTGAPLNSVQLIPATVLDHVGRSLGWGRARHRSLRFEPYTAGGVLYTTINSSPFRLWAFAICTNKSNRI